MGSIRFVLGGIRSGKSRFAEEDAATWESATGGKVVYVATSRALDAEMRDRVARHQERRPASWRTVESHVGVAGDIEAAVEPDALVLLDCVNMLVSNILMQIDEEVLEANRSDAIDSVLAAVDELLAVLSDRRGRAILISNEVGMAPVALSPLGRAFQDAIGLTHQRVAAAADDVFLLVAGLSHKLK